MDLPTALGLGAAFLTSVAFVPQVVRNFRRKHVDDLSFSTFGTFTLGVNALNLWQMWAYRKPPSSAT